MQLIRVCADHSDAVSALSVYEWMRAPRSMGGAALRPTTYTYTAAMRAALGANMLDRALQVRPVCYTSTGVHRGSWAVKRITLGWRQLNFPIPTCASQAVCLCQVVPELLFHLSPNSRAPCWVAAQPHRQPWLLPCGCQGRAAGPRSASTMAMLVQLRSCLMQSDACCAALAGVGRLPGSRRAP